MMEFYWPQKCFLKRHLYPYGVGLILSFLFMASSGKAFESIPATKASEQVIEFEAYDPTIKYEIFQLLKPAIQAANEILIDFKIPKKIKITQDSITQGDPGENRIKLVIPYGTTSKKEFHKFYDEGMDAALIHEYGHLIFSFINLESIYPYTSFIYEKLYAFKFRLIYLNIYFKKLGEGFSCDDLRGYSSTTADKCKEYKTVLSEIKDLKQKYKSPFVNTVPYEEFIADLLAVLAVKDGQALSRVTNNSRRDFTQKGPPCEEYGCFNAEYFGPSRRLLWTYFESRNKSLEAARFIIKAAFDAVGKEVKRRDAHGLYSISNQDISEQQIEEGFHQTLLDSMGLSISP